MARPSTPDERSRAAEMRERGLSYGQIAYILGRDWRTIWRWFNPEDQRKARERSHAWRAKDRRRAKESRRASYHKRAAEGVFGNCKRCHGPLRGKLRTSRKLCSRCLREDREWFWREIEHRWGQGESLAQIAFVMNCETAKISNAMRRMRENGWELPYRRLDSRRIR